MNHRRIDESEWRMWRDMAVAWRAIRRSPGFAVTATVTIALGVGACTAIFSVTNAVLLRPLPYTDPTRLVSVCSDLAARGVKDWPFSNADFFDLRSTAKATFADVAAVRTVKTVWQKEDGTPEQISVGLVTPNFFGLLGTRIEAGRNFSDADGEPQPPGANSPQPRVPQTVILSHEYWQRRYGGSPAALGHETSSGAVIVGVLAPGFELLLPPRMNLERSPDVWIAARLNYDTANRNNVAYQVIGRLKENATLEAARAEADTVSEALRSEDPIHRSARFQIRIEPMQRYLSDEVRPALLSLMGAAIFLLLIACANVANLLLVRTSRRERELAVRAALGAGTRQLIRPLLAEALILCGLGTLLGVGLAWLGIRELIHIAPASLPRLSSIAIDPVVIGFTALLGLAAAGLFGLIPVVRVLRPNVITVLRSSGRSAALGSGKGLRDGVVVGEVALSFVLLIGSGLMIRSFIALQGVDPGFEPNGLLTMQILGPRGAQSPEERAAFVRDVQTHLAAIPGIDRVTAANPLPLAGGFSAIRWGTEEALTDPSKFRAAEPQTVLPGYFETLGTKLIAGRTFEPPDNVIGQNRVVIDRHLAEKAFPNGTAVGKRILIRARTPEAEWVEVIGVVAHQRTNSLAEVGREQVFFTDAFFGHGVATRWAIRTTRDPSQLAELVRNELARTSPRLVVAEIQPMEVLMERAKSKTRFCLLLLAALSAIAVLLAGVGLYGVISTVVRQRTAEIGIRMAIGASPAQVFKLLIGEGLSLSVLGLAIGVFGALALTRWMESMLVGVEATDPLTFAAMGILFLIIAAIASWAPAFRAARLDPTAALRAE